MSNNRPPLGTQQPAVPRRPPHLYIRQDMSSAPRSPQLSPVRRQPVQMTLPSRPRIQSAPDNYPTTSTTPVSFPEPQFYRSTSTGTFHRESLSPPSNRSSHSLNNNAYNSNNMGIPYTSPSVASFSSSYAEDDHSFGSGSFEVCSPIPSLLSSNSSVAR